MNTLTLEQVLAANKSAIEEAQGVASVALAGFEKLVALNLAATKSALLDTSTDFLSAFTAANPSDALAAQASLIKPMAEKSVSYGRSVYAIATETGAELTKVAEAKAAESQKALTSAIETLAKSAPAGSESVVAALKSAMTVGQQAIDTAKSTAKKAFDLAEQQANTVTDSALNSVKAPARKK